MAMQLFPPRLFMREQRFDLGSQTFTLAGNPISFNLRQLNYLRALLVHLSGTYTVATATLVFNALQPYNIVRQFLLNVPNNPMPVFNLGGAAMHVWNLRNADFAPHRKQFRFPVILNNAMDSADVTNWTLRLNGSYMPTDPAGIPGAVVDFIQTYEQGLPLPVGWLLYDGDVLGKDVGSIRTGQITELESQITIAGGATLGSVAGVSPRIYTSLRRRVPLVAG
jgi:hypothetical protein